MSDDAPQLDTLDLSLLRIGEGCDGVMADELTPDVFQRCERLLRLGLVSPGKRIGEISVYHSTPEGIRRGFPEWTMHRPETPNAAA